MSISELAAASGLAPATLHRLARTLVDLGYLRQEPSRRYALGPRLFLLAESSSTMLNSVALPHLAHLVDEIGETANLAMLDGDQVAYVAQAPGRHSMRMFTEVGRRVLPHCTAVGKALLAPALTDDDVRALLARTGLPRHTPHTVTDPEELLAQLDADPRPRLRDGRGRAGGRRPLRGGRGPGLADPAGDVGLGPGPADERRAAGARRTRAPGGRAEPGRGALLTRAAAPGKVGKFTR